MKKLLDIILFVVGIILLIILGVVAHSEYVLPTWIFVLALVTGISLFGVGGLLILRRII